MVDRVRILLVLEAGLEQLLHLVDAAFVVREELHRQPLEDHIILSERARLDSVFSQSNHPHLIAPPSS